MIDLQWQAARRILVVRLDNLGDVLVTTPAIHAIARSLPEAQITLLASSVGAQVGRLNPDIAQVIEYEAPWMDPWCKLPQNIEYERAMIERVRAGRYDAAIIFTSFHQSPLPAAYLCYLADIPLRAAASIDGPGSLLTTRHKHPERMMHEVERGLDLVRALGIDTNERDLMLAVPPDSRRAASAVLTRLGVSRNGPMIVVHPGCSMPARTYPWELYAEVVTQLARRLEATVLLTGAVGERDLVERVLSRVDAGASTRAHTLAGTLTFPELCAVIEAANLTVTNNTGPMHISAAVKTPVVALFALTNPPEQWGPWGVAYRQLYHEVPCRICYSRICPYRHECLALVTPDQVVDAAVRLLDETRASRWSARDARQSEVSA